VSSFFNPEVFLRCLWRGELAVLSWMSGFEDFSCHLFFSDFLLPIEAHDIRPFFLRETGIRELSFRGLSSSVALTFCF